MYLKFNKMLCYFFIRNRVWSEYQRNLRRGIRSQTTLAELLIRGKYVIVKLSDLFKFKLKSLPHPLVSFWQQTTSWRETTIILKIFFLVIFFNELKHMFFSKRVRVGSTRKFLCFLVEQSIIKTPWERKLKKLTSQKAKVSPV